MDKQPAHPVKHNRAHKAPRPLQYVMLWMLAALMISPANASNEPQNTPATPGHVSGWQLPPPHSMVYRIKKYGSEVGLLSNTLSRNEHILEYHSKATTSGLASLFMSGELSETSRLSQSGAQPLRQLSYRLDHSSKRKKNQLIQFTLNPQGELKLQARYRNKTHNLQPDQAAWSRQVMPLLMASYLSHNPQQDFQQFLIVDKGRLQNYTYWLEKAENIRIAGSVYATLKFKITRQGSNRHSYAWLSSAHYFLPVKIEQYKDRKKSASLVLKQFSQQQKPETQNNRT